MDRPAPDAPNPDVPPAEPPAEPPAAPALGHAEAHDAEPAPHPASEIDPQPAPAPPPIPRPLSRRERYAHRRGEPRTFAILWMAFMVAAIMVSVSPVGASGLVSVETYRPSARLLAALMGVGIAVVWPMVRLSQVRPRFLGRAMVQDLVIVMVPIAAMCTAQSAPWMAGWPLNVGAAMALGLLGWSMVVGGVMLHAFASEAARDRTPIPDCPAPTRALDTGVGTPDVGARVSAMLVLVAVAVTGPLVSALAYAPGSSVHGDAGLKPDLALMASPVGFAMEVARDRVWTGRAAAIGPDHWWGVGLILLIGAGMLASGYGRVRRRERAGVW